MSKTTQHKIAPLGKITILDEIGQGGFGRVYKAKMEGISIPFAIKIFEPSTFNNYDTALQRFRFEAEFLFSLRHQHIVQIYNIGEIENKPYILMEFFDGYDLYTARKKVSSPPPGQVIDFFMRIVQGISYAHDRSLVHRDIKPSNIMTKKGDARILDFGIATKIDPAGERFTRIGSTPVGDAFCAPELHENPRLIDPRTDIYSVGACWYWLLTGLTPKGVGWEKAIRNIDGVSPDYERVLLTCLKPIDARYPNARELAKDLELLTSGQKIAARNDEIDDIAAIILGAISSLTVNDSFGASLYAIEKQIGTMVSRFTLGIYLRKLLRLELVEDQIGHDFNGEEYRVFRLLDKGFLLIEEQQGRIEQLLLKCQPEPIDEPQSSILF